MTQIFSSSSRLANFRERKTEDFLNQQPQFKLTIPQEQKITYEPSSGLNSTKTSIRLFKGRLERAHPTDQDSNQTGKTQFKSTATVDTEPRTQSRLSSHDCRDDMKLVLHDSPNLNQTKSLIQRQAKPGKRIMILKETPKQIPQRQIVEQDTSKPAQKHEIPQKQKILEQKQEIKPYIHPHDQKPIKEQQIQESKQVVIENENDLVMCTEGCGRTFNRKALEKHAKACKLVFMSKRKQFNSEAKRLASKQQANIVKQNKLKQKNQLLKTKSKGFEKTSDNWKAASEDLRAVIKAAKKQEGKIEIQAEQCAQKQDECALNLVSCQYCEKMFANVLFEKHSENCMRKKEKEREAEKKKTGLAKKK